MSPNGWDELAALLRLEKVARTAPGIAREPAGGIYGQWLREMRAVLADLDRLRSPEPVSSEAVSPLKEKAS